MNCKGCTQFEESDNYCKALKCYVQNPSWDKPCVVQSVDALVME